MYRFQDLTRFQDLIGSLYEAFTHHWGGGGGNGGHFD